MERSGKLLTKYVSNTPTKIQSQAENKSKERAASNAHSKRVNGSAPHVMFAAVSKAPTREEVQGLRHELTVYYKVARMRFVDNVIQSVDHFLLSGQESPLHILTPKFISSLTEDQLKQIAGENMATTNRRHQLVTEIEKLEAGRKVVQL